MDNTTVISGFLESVFSGHATVQSNKELTLNVLGDLLQFLAHREGLVATAKLEKAQRSVAVRRRSSHWPILHTALLSAHFLPVQKAPIPGFYQYEPVDVPVGYRVNFTDSLDLMQVWYSYGKPCKAQGLMDLLVFNRGTWYPIREMTCEQGTLVIQTLGLQIELYPLDRLVWLQQQVLTPQPPAPSSPSDLPTARLGANDLNPRDSLTQFPDINQLGACLIESGLLSPAQIEVAVLDQKSTGMQLGEILVKRGWVKQQTIEFLMNRVILPQRAAARQELALTKHKLEQRLEQDPVPLRQPKRSSEPESPQRVGQKLAPEPKASNLQVHKLTPQATPKPPPQPSAVPSVHERETLVTYEPINLDLDEPQDM